MVVPRDQAVPNRLLRQAREARELTQEEVADGLIQLGAGGVNGGMVSKWERGICRPSRFHRRLLCQFFKMEQLGEQLGDADIRELAAIYQGDLLRRRGEYELAAQRLQSTEPYTPQVTAAVEGLRHQTLARAHAEYGQREAFVMAIGRAEEAARELEPGTEDWGNEFGLVPVLHEKAHGFTLLWEAERALDIYAETQAGFQTASLRDLGNFAILRAQAHAYAGNVDTGVRLALDGLAFAKRYGSARHVSRVQRMYDRLQDTPMGSSARRRDLAEAPRAA